MCFRGRKEEGRRKEGRRKSNLRKKRGWLAVNFPKGNLWKTFEKYITESFNRELHICASEMQPTVPHQSLAKVSELLEVCDESGLVLVPKEHYHQYQTKKTDEHYCECYLGALSSINSRYLSRTHSFIRGFSRLYKLTWPTWVGGRPKKWLKTNTSGRKQWTTYALPHPFMERGGLDSDES